MRIYETTFVVNPQTDDATINSRVQAVSGLITKNGGKIVLEDHLGTRRLAYPIKGLTQGYYGSFIFEGPAMVLPLLDRLYKQEESYIRFITIQYEADPQELLNQRAALSLSEEPVSDRAGAAPEMPRPVAQRRPEPGDLRPVEPKAADVPVAKAAPAIADVPEKESLADEEKPQSRTEERAEEEEEEL